MLTTFLIGMFYCLDALYGERRDRSILFWKSLPVPDRTTVLSKVVIPLVVLPLLGFVIGQATQVILLMLGTMILQGSGLGAGTLWSEFHFFQGPLVMIYGLTVFVLWWAPIYSWLLLVSAWARRATLLWAVLPLLAVSALERIAFNTSYFLSMLQYRFGGAMKEGFAFAPKGSSHGVIDQLTQLDPAKFLSRPGLWVGLVFAAAFLAAAVRLRRNREPI
ncbi:MAG TPA: ABC transporter permease, partial [Thermoanaerobaculia bacterium]|nr:ABC transporter permease [Thermoanaerobaculia bacterium]